MLSILAVAGCDRSTGPRDGRAGAGNLTAIRASNLVLAPGDTSTVGVVVRDGASTYELPAVVYPWPAGLATAWESSDASVVSVDAVGLVTARRAGSATIWVNVHGLRDSGTVTVRAAPPPPFLLSQISAGGAHACGVDMAGSAVCWGSNWSGELGLGAARPFTAILAPVRVRGGLQFLALHAGSSFTCGLTLARVAHCWGDNLFGQLGDGSRTARAAPTPVVGSERFAALATGASTSCGLTAEGVALCWGELGTRQVTRPERIGAGAAARYVAVTAGGGYACGLTAEGGAECWGRNDYGQLGAGSIGGARDTPVQVAGGLRFGAISAGTLHACALTTDGYAMCWGWGADGRLGDGEGGTYAAPVRVAGAHVFTKVDAGMAHTCGVRGDGVALCWGSNWRGQLGNALPFGDPRYQAQDYRSFTPVPVLAPGVAFTHVDAGVGDLTCGRATDGAAYCWGLNSVGQLGSGQRSWYPGTRVSLGTTPVAVVGPPGG